MTKTPMTKAELQRRIETLEHDLAFLARLTANAMALQGLEDSARQVRKMRDFYESKIDWPEVRIIR